MHYTTKGTCSRAIDVEIEGTKIKSVAFTGGCNGNTQGISTLVEGMEIDEVIRRLEGISCNGRATSCPDQLAKALRQYQNEQ